MKKAIIWLIVAALALSLFGCIAVKQDDIAITWKKAFRDENYPAGGLKNDEVAFARTLGKVFIVDNVPQSELVGLDDEGLLPRYSLLHPEPPEKQDLMQECISYAVMHNYDRFVLPVNDSYMSLPNSHDRAYWWSVDISCDINTSNFTRQEDGSTVYFCLCVLKTPLYSEYYEWNRQQAEAFEVAKQVVADMPENCVSDYDKALYLYRYLTDNVQYSYDYEYRAGEDYYTYAQNLYYDTLVRHKTVCSGYGCSFAWLCELAGLEAFPASGQYGATESHLWTMVKVDGEYYWFDPTWDAGAYPERYQYFGISDEEMEERGGSRHLYQAYDELLPDCPTSLPRPSVTQPLFSRGTVSGVTYRNDDFNLMCELPGEWTFLNDAQIEQGDGDQLTPFETLLADSDSAYDICAVSEDHEELSVELFRRRDDASAFAEMLRMSLNSTLDSDAGEVESITFCGRNCQSVRFDLTAEETVFCLRFVVVPLEDALLLIRVLSNTPERCQQLLDCFSAIKG